MPTVMITGANRGIGLGLAKAYLETGWDVIATCRNPDSADDLKALGGSLEIHKMEVTDADDVSALATALQGRAIDILINNAGVIGGLRFKKDGPGQSFGAIDYEGFAYTLEVNTLAPLRVAERFITNLMSGQQKKLINITSRMGSLTEMEPGFIAYRTSKAALNAAMLNIVPDMKERGITVAVLHPGWVKTDMGSDAAPLLVDDSVKGLVEVIDSLTLKDTGAYRNNLGETIPW